ncbi:hypothetical protein [Nocardia brasiliensis]|uniref:hypothetical protein n=1 Tax=Nocardia brasiliensis TaxID=37326 RepID=UPI0024562BE0|nr:hypothetical protein [Nocardia brasiliensis]
MFEHLKVGDSIMWWTDAHDRGVEPDHPDARRRTGTITNVYRHPRDNDRVVALGVQCSGLLGSYGATVRPDYNHRPTLAD